MVLLQSGADCAVTLKSIRRSLRDRSLQGIGNERRSRHTIFELLARFRTVVEDLQGHFEPKGIYLDPFDFALHDEAVLLRHYSAAE